METPVLNMFMDLADRQGKWFYDEAFACWCLEDLLYTPVPKDVRFQRLSVYAPKELLNEDGTLTEAAKSAPVVFLNSAAGYAQMPHEWLENPRCKAPQYLKRGWVYVTCGCRGRETKDAEGNWAGKAPATLVDFKTAIRFLRHNRAYLPGDWEKIVSVGTSAGGAMSTLIGVTGDNEKFLPYLEENGAFMDESDAVWAAQIYCPITDLEHADMAYEWMFRADKECEAGPAGPAEIMSSFKEVLSARLSEMYIAYFNSLELKNPVTGEVLVLNEDGRSGSGYDYLMKCLNESATKYLTLLQQGKLPVKYSVEEYLSGNYTCMKRGGPPPRPEGEKKDGPRPSMGEMQLRPPKGQVVEHKGPSMVEVQGNDKSGWLTWDGEQARVSDLDTYVLSHRRRMKGCTAFDSLKMSSPENEVYGMQESAFVHFSVDLAQAIDSLKEQFPEECEAYQKTLVVPLDDESLAYRIALYNPWRYIGTGEKCKQAEHYRVRVGASDADTSFMISMTLALKLANAGCGSVDYALVWEQPHCDADYPEEVCDWIASLL